jgi:hypothetical protein
VAKPGPDFEIATEYSAIYPALTLETPRRAVAICPLSDVFDIVLASNSGWGITYCLLVAMGWIAPHSAGVLSKMMPSSNASSKATRVPEIL